MLFTLLSVSSAFSGCGDLPSAPTRTTCVGGGYHNAIQPLHTMAPRVRLGDARTRPCAEQCEEYLRGRPGCCMQKTNLAHCWVYPGSRKEAIYVQEGGAYLQAVSCDPPTYTGHEFTQAIRPTNACPGGFEPITTAAQCERANNELVAGVFLPVRPTHPGWTTRPGGCFLQVDGYYRLRGYVIFNNNLVGGLGEPGYKDMKICVRSTPITGPPACPLPTEPDTASRGCAPAGYTGNEGANCLNGNTAYATFFDAWEACDSEPECDMVIRWTHWSWDGYRYFMRRSTDRVTYDAEGFTYACKDRCDGILAARSDGGRWAKGAEGETCDQTCGRLGKSCDAGSVEKMTCINSAARISAAMLEAGHRCASTPDSRDYAGSPFFGRSGACYWFGPQRNAPADVVAAGPPSSVCNAVEASALRGGRVSLCYCK